MHYHGTPITPQKVLHTLAGRNFCVSFSAPDQAKLCHQIGQSVMLDNGAFSVWKRGIEIDWNKWWEWAEPWLDCPTTWAVLPDSIEGDETENDRLTDEWGHVPKGVPVWHLHESFYRLASLAGRFHRVCFGSSGQFSTVGSAVWHRRVEGAFNTLADEFGRVPFVHMLRGMSLSGDQYPFASVDSTDIARNHHLPHKNAVKMADRWDSVQCPHRWNRVDQLEIAV